MPGKGRAPLARAAAPTGQLTAARNGSTRNGAAASSLGPERVVAIQRARILAAMVDMCAERGAPNVAVANVVARAGVSRRTFYEIFTGYEDCFLAAFDEGVAQASKWLFEAYDPQAPWLERVRSATVALLAFLDAEPGIGRLLVVDSLGMGGAALAHRQGVIARLTVVVNEGRIAKVNPGSRRKAVRPGDGGELSALTAEGVVGGAVSVVHARMLGPQPVRLIGMAGPLLCMIVLPYLGPAAARAESKRRVPERPRRPSPVSSDPLRDLEIRLTYRTVRVLLAVGECPGASNREIASMAGIADQGQISKLLARLQRLALVENMGLTPGKGAPNSWALTKHGREVERAMSAGASDRQRR